MEARYVQLHLRKCGVIVHHAAPMPSTSDGRQAVVVYLEAGLRQADLARRCVLRLPGVIGVKFSGHTPTIMFVFGAEPGGRTAVNGGRPTRPGAPRQQIQRPGPVKVKPAPGPVKSPAAVRRRTTVPSQS